MSDVLWSYDQLARFTRYEDPEVRYWAAERLFSLYPDDACDAIVALVLDDHDALPDLVIDHIGLHGSHRHVPMLLRGLRKGAGAIPGRCCEALARLGYAGTPQLAREALYQRDVPEECLALMVSAMALMRGGDSDHEALECARELLLRRPELFGEPAALKAAIALGIPADFSELLLNWLTALHFKGLDRIEVSIYVLSEALQTEECGWCIRTDRAGRVDIRRTFKAIENSYDLELRDVITREDREEITACFGRGLFSEMALCLGRFIRSRARALRHAAADPLPARLDALGEAFSRPSIAAIVEPLEPAIHQWLIGLLISAAVKASCYRNFALDLEAAGEDLEALLALAGTESSSLLATLPEKLAGAARSADRAGEARVEDWCLRTLDARGPFFPKAIALDTLGAMGKAQWIPEIASHLSDENADIYGAAERALASIGAPVIGHTRAVLAHGGGHPDTVQSLIKLSCDMCRRDSLRIMVEHFDEIYETIGPEATAEAAAVLGHRDLIPPLRRWLSHSPALVGHTLLLVGAIHNLPIPEEESILKAIDDYWKRTDESDGNSRESRYLM